ncbi:ROK family protein [Pseudomonas sp. zfem001]|uniref:ROK family protein n=1 Tax=Pseudomonas sp. zfem001 TaxID=3078196 RepID=UPI0029278B56|nr:ROK family protein [Pseudomonas sp. zfem001]MDU9408301.1 ROK family protein [Pseudomonas sp. zfem001]
MQPPTLGIDLGGTKLLMVAADHESRVVTGPRFTPQQLHQHLVEFMTQHGIERANIGIAVPGLVDASQRLVACDVLPHFTGWRPQTELAAVAQRVTVLNDVKAALGEEFHDAPASLTAVMIMVGTAIGAGILADGRPLRGCSGWAGELGYIPVLDADGQLRRLDERAGGAAIATYCNMPADELARLAQAGDAWVLASIADAGQAFGLGLATVINLINPSVIALGGGTLALPGYLDAALASAQKASIATLWRACEIRMVRTGHKVVALGAARAASD